jgi:hypothetical protein
MNGEPGKVRKIDHKVLEERVVLSHRNVLKQGLSSHDMALKASHDLTSTRLMIHSTSCERVNQPRTRILAIPDFT